MEIPRLPVHDVGEDDTEDLLSTSDLQTSLVDRKPLPKMIHILGSGNIGNFIAHSLAGIPGRPPITLILHRRTLIDVFEKRERTIELIRNNILEYSTGYEVELSLPQDSVQTTEIDGKDIIHNLIISVKATNTILALSSVAHRLTRDSTILFLQNGMGILDEVNSKIFPNIETRPNYMLGIITHGLYRKRYFGVIHEGFGTLAVGAIPLHQPGELDDTEERTKYMIPPSSRYILRTLTRTPVLAAVAFTPMELMLQQIEKLAVNAIINPLTVMFDCKNGELLQNFAISRVMRLLLYEISLVIRSLPELQNVPNVQTRFSAHRLEAQIVNIAQKTSRNISSMLQDVRNGQETEIRYINGYIVRRGEELGIRCVMNYMLEKMVRGKQQMNSIKQQGLLPLVE